MSVTDYRIIEQVHIGFAPSFVVLFVSHASYQKAGS